jgi:hypothetical protein
MMTSRGIDHLVLAVRDLDAARSRYAGWGFTLTPRAQHPFGTANSLVQLDGNFLELLAIDDPARIPPAAPGGFSFAAAGLDAHPVLDFSRDARLPDGSTARVGFSLAFVTDARVPEAAFFTCQQHAPQHFWKPEFQRHANTARQVVEVVMVAPEPSALRPLFAGLQGADAASLADGQLDIRTARGGAISVMAPDRFARRFPDLGVADAPRTPYLAALRITVADAGAAQTAIGHGGTSCRKTELGFAVAARDAFGVVIEFSAA